jgi:hypothetical protein
VCEDFVELKMGVELKLVLLSTEQKGSLATMRGIASACKISQLLYWPSIATDLAYSQSHARLSHDFDFTTNCLSRLL